MPGRKGYGHGRKGRGRGRRIINYLQPCLLLMLYREPTHGYNLANGLNEFGLDPDTIDSSLIYRALREMEADEFIHSSWDDESLGPRRRVYQITESGKTFLSEWMEDLERLKIEIDILTREYAKLKQS